MNCKVYTFDMNDPEKVLITKDNTSYLKIRLNLLPSVSPAPSKILFECSFGNNFWNSLVIFDFLQVSELVWPLNVWQNPLVVSDGKKDSSQPPFLFSKLVILSKFL